jgi:succinoglycan biosynthesis transport protein ExoP
VEDEIDLREYIDVLLRHWKLIVIITTIVVFVAGLVSFLLPSTYEAKATVLITGGEQKTLITLAKSPHVATQVIEQLGNKLESKEQRLGNMLDKVQVSGTGNFTEISVKSTDAQKAAAIANAWAESYQDYVDSYYRRVSLSPEELQIQANAARKEYEEKQKAWEDFIGDNRIDELSRQIADKELLCDVKSLREQIKAGSPSPASAAANNLAFVLLKTGASINLTVDLQVATDQLSGLNVNLDDVDALISTLEVRSGGTQGQSITELRQEISQIKAELEFENAKERDLMSSRDITWEAYISVASKVAEAKVAAQAQATIIRVAELAVVPESPVAPRVVMNISIALVLGLVVAVFGAFVVEYFKKTGVKADRRKEE